MLNTEENLKDSFLLIKDQIRATEEQWQIEKNTHANAPLFELVYEQDGIKLLRFGINSTVIKVQKDFVIMKSKLHLVEEQALVEAFKYLKQGNRIALVDIFSHSDFAILSDDNNLASTHTIVFLKNADGTFAFIDPNDYRFSAHIAEFCNMSPSFSPSKFVTNLNPTAYFTKKDSGFDIKIYQGMPPEFQACMPRDCIDISVKIGFEILELLKQENILSQETINAALRSVTNNPLIDAGLTSLFSKSWDRSLQQAESQKINDLRELIRKNAKIWEAKLSKYGIKYQGLSFKAIEDLYLRLPSK